MIKIGDIIEDSEDSDCFYRGVVTQLNPIKYIVQLVVWCGETIEDDEIIGKEVEQQWWVLDKIN